jgi:hypothetical protein
MMLAGLISGCAGVNTAKLDPSGQFKANYLVIHPDGYALNEKNEPLSTDELRQELEATLLPHIYHFAKELQNPAPNSEVASCYRNGERTLRLLIFVHGGLNGYDASFQHMRDLVEPIADSDGHQFNVVKGSCYYPIFVNWDSAGFDSFTDDLFRIRFGHADMALAIITSPFVIASHFVSSVVNLPVSVFHNGELLAERIKGALEEGDPGYCVALDTAGYLPLHTLYFATIPLLEGFGTPTWAIMKRRAQLAVANELTDKPGSQNFSWRRLSGQHDEYRMQAQKANPQLHDEGAFRTLITTLQKNMQPDNGSWKWSDSGVRVEVTFVGHSMGSMLINRVVDLLEGSKQSQQMPVDNLIYLAPAASIDELDQMTIPYVERINQGKGARDNPTALWFFALNRRDETREIPLMSLGLLPRGSLLTWIDTFLEGETTWGQSTSGRTWNLMNSYGINKTVSTYPGTKNCFTPYWNPAHGVPPEYLPLTQQLRAREITSGSRHLTLQTRGLLKLYDSPRRIGADNVPESHGDFTRPRFFLEALCTVKETAFRSREVCQKRPGQIDP